MCGGDASCPTVDCEFNSSMLLYRIYLDRRNGEKRQRGALAPENRGGTGERYDTWIVVISRTTLVGTIGSKVQPLAAV